MKGDITIKRANTAYSSTIKPEILGRHDVVTFQVVNGRIATRIQLYFNSHGDLEVLGDARLKIIPEASNHIKLGLED